VSVYLKKSTELLDRQIEFIEKQIGAEQCVVDCPLCKQSQSRSNLKWTGSVVEWVELIYALYTVKRINNGKITLMELFQQMGEIFDFEVKEFANYFMNIKKGRTDNEPNSRIC
jgi:hypothetical protein